MKIYFQFVVKVILIWSIAGSSIAAVIFTDDFDSAASPLWGNEQGSWNDKGGAYQSTSGNQAFSLLPTDLRDFSVELDINDVWDGGVVLRSSYNGGLFNGIALITGGLGGGGTGVYWHEFVNGGNSPVLKHSGALFPSKSDIHLKIDVFGDTYSAFVNGTLVTTLTSSLYSQGQVGLFNNRLGQSFDNISVSSVPEPSTIFLAAFGIAGLCMLRRNKKSYKVQASA
ncbi:PEP-CTERM sorting domain-containing protein [Agarivorans sp. QJM3NY_25]|uniref:PEP-CTERM sorting domain-containing protein n=1 Tax=Agarivorans sp. QJM3NY_25 TaxID=3421430 RepID=UPI003D7D25D0